MAVSFSFKEEHSPIFGKIRRPIAYTYFKHKSNNIWQPITLIVDTGADYTLLPRFMSEPLGIQLTKDCKTIETQGVGGTSKVYLFKGRSKVKIGEFYRQVPIGFLDNDYIPPLLGRHEFFETFKVVFEKFKTTFR
jgi:predicted aspartyl protease